MSQLFADVPFFDRILLRTLQYAVPPSDRDDWLRTWHSEIWHLNHHRAAQTRPATLVVGLTRDALWLRTESWRRALDGTATLCIAVLASLCMAFAVVGLLLTGS